MYRERKLTSRCGAFRCAIQCALFITMLVGIALPNHAWAGDCPRKHEYAVYLSPGYQPGVPWGGYHVTITEFSANHVCHGDKGSMKQVLRKVWRDVQGSQSFSFQSKSRKDYWPRRGSQYIAATGLGIEWGVGFNSSLLTNKLKPELQKEGFLGLKSHWHISLYSHTENEAIQKFEATLKNKPWQLFVVRKPDKQCQANGKSCPAAYWEEIN